MKTEELKMEYLIIYAHPNAKSFNHAIKETIEAGLRESAKDYLLRDLYQMRFDPLLNLNDLSLMQEGKVAEEIRREQELIKDASVLIFIYPVWWFGMPAILKGYIDRVFSYGFAFEFTDKGPEGLLLNKRVVIFNTAEGTERLYSSLGYAEAMKTTTAAGIFEFCGMKVVLHKYFYEVNSVT